MNYKQAQLELVSFLLQEHESGKDKEFINPKDFWDKKGISPEEQTIIRKLLFKNELVSHKHAPISNTQELQLTAHRGYPLNKDDLDNNGLYRTDQQKLRNLIQKLSILPLAVSAIELIRLFVCFIKWLNECYC